MKLRKPIVRLARELNADGPDKYFLHSVTFFNQTNMVADGYEEITSQLDEEGKLVIVLIVNEDPDVPEMKMLTPVVHTIEIGALPFENDGIIKVRLVGSERGPDDPDETEVPSSDAEEIERPIGNE